LSYQVTDGELTHILATVISEEADYPSSVELLEQLEATQKAALYVLAAITNKKFRTLLIGGNGRFENEREGFALLVDLAARAAQARERNPRAPGPGRPKAIIPFSSWPNALDFCALMVGMIQTKERGRWPSNPKAYQLCEQFWTAAGGMPHGGLAAIDGSLTAWRLHLRNAQRYRPPHPVGAWLANIIAPPTQEPRPRIAQFRHRFLRTKGQRALGGDT
jgi:hypothetical protein